jgi:signal transduction histidine kinase
MSFTAIAHAETIPVTVPLLRRGERRAGPGIRLAALRVPLVAKLAGANLVVVVSMLLLWSRTSVSIGAAAWISAAALLVVHLALVLIALRPIRDLEAVAGRVWHGDFGARVNRSMVADQEVLRVGAMFNILLDSLEADRARLQALASDVIEAGERERAAIARELQDTTAQHVAALLFELGAAARDANDPALAERLRGVRDHAEGILEEVRSLSHSVHPAVLDDLGLEAAIRRLAREAGNGNAIELDVQTQLDPSRLPRNIETTIYRVAQEAIRNATRHANPQNITVSLRRTPAAVQLAVQDDGCGFEPATIERGSRSARGITAMRERLALVEGWLEIKSSEGRGTIITATVPLDADPARALKEERHDW